MRAERLLSLLVLLQARGKVTAEELARELGVSVRTIYRDLDALSVAGVPVWASGGPGGGCQLMDGYRSSLIGISATEATALLATSTDALATTDLGADLALARLKVVAAMPARSRPKVAAEAARFHIDADPWFRPVAAVPNLAVLVRAVRAEVRLRIVYGGSGARPRRVTVDPLGMVAKAGTWYLVARADRTIRAYRADRIRDVVALEEGFVSPDGFDLAAFWEQWALDFETSRPQVAVTVRISPRIWDDLPEIFGDAVRPRMDRAGPADATGWRTIELSFESAVAARYRILGFGPDAEILTPESVRGEVLDMLAATTALYLGTVGAV